MSQGGSDIVKTLLKHYPTLPDSQFISRLNLSLLLLVASEANSVHTGTAIFKTLASLSFFFGGLSRAFASSEDVNTVWPLLLQLVKGGLQDRFQLFMVLGLGCSVLGDVLLIPSRETYYRHVQPQPQQPQPQPQPKGKKSKLKGPVAVAAPEQKTDGKEVEEGQTLSFKAGTFFFALAHIAYSFAFIYDINRTPINWVWFAGAFSLGTGVSLALGVFSANSRFLNIPPDMAPLVRSYVGIITTMVATASATDKGWQKIVGAWLFMISDMFVAVDVFGKKPAAKASPPGAQIMKYVAKPGWRFRAFGWWAYFWAQMILAGTI
ncbi:hypothetical protein FA15DRAFT_672799 [Coprinopsis marcescibilis]|uniref:YhhN domain-containing protein n=1 Tax=Coprinopsis marcescibilis TaxID=230819 RepID=A0A5C3KZ42_COPMA|nr:hypothetical protein FA15DRAFT_672799 [Coprinopsis marcescibilis]